MIIQCATCKKKFDVPASAITASGRLVQCSSCGNKWTQYPIKLKKEIKQPTILKKPKKKKTTPIPYSAEYMKQKWGTTVQSYAKNNQLISAVKKDSSIKKAKKKKVYKTNEKPSFGFFNYIITLSIFSIFLVGILNFERSRLSRKFPFLEPYINHFFETLENFKIFILDFYN